MISTDFLYNCKFILDIYENLWFPYKRRRIWSRLKRLESEVQRLSRDYNLEKFTKE